MRLIPTPVFLLLFGIPLNFLYHLLTNKLLVVQVILLREHSLGPHHLLLVGDPIEELGFLRLLKLTEGIELMMVPLGG